jgi:hypothetical protein
VPDPFACIALGLGVSRRELRVIDNAERTKTHQSRLAIIAGLDHCASGRSYRPSPQRRQTPPAGLKPVTLEREPRAAGPGYHRRTGQGTKMPQAHSRQPRAAGNPSAPQACRSVFTASLPKLCRLQLAERSHIPTRLHRGRQLRYDGADVDRRLFGDSNSARVAQPRRKSSRVIPERRLRDSVARRPYVLSPYVCQTPATR